MLAGTGCHRQVHGAHGGPAGGVQLQAHARLVAGAILVAHETPQIETFIQRRELAGGASARMHGAFI